MENKALVTEITSNYGSNIIGRVEGSKYYELTLNIKGDFRLQFWVTDEFTNKHLTCINRIAEVTTGSYIYRFLAAADAVIEFKMSGKGTASDIVLKEV